MHRGRLEGSRDDDDGGAELGEAAAEDQDGTCQHAVLDLRQQHGAEDREPAGAEAVRRRLEVARDLG